MKFIKGQKVECIDDSFSNFLKNGEIYTIIKKQHPFEYIVNGCNVSWVESRFKTIIQSIDDIVKGMILTHKHRGKIVVHNKHKYPGIKEVGYKYEGTIWYCRDLTQFEEYKPKEKENKQMKEYKVIKPFNIYDLWTTFNNDCVEFRRQFGQLLEEETIRNFSASHKYTSWGDIKFSKILMNNLHHLEEKGFIEEVIPDVVLKPGMRLREGGYKHKYTVVESGDGTRFNRISLLGDGHKDTDYAPYILDFGKTYSKKMTLQKLNCESGYIFEVIDG